MSPMIFYTLQFKFILAGKINPIAGKINITEEHVLKLPRGKKKKHNVLKEVGGTATNTENFAGNQALVCSETRQAKRKNWSPTSLSPQAAATPASRAPGLGI